MSRPERPPAPAAPVSDIAARDKAATGEPPHLSTAQLFRDCNEILIEHRGERYRLRLTRQDKLILTK